MPKPNLAKIELKITDDALDEVSKEFLQGMVNRMVISFHKYGAVALAYPDKVNAIQSLHQRLAKYEETGNSDFLMDVGNFAMIEHMHPAHPNAHFEGTDSDQSPGRTTQNGEVTSGSNKSIKI